MSSQLRWTLLVVVGIAFGAWLVMSSRMPATFSLNGRVVPIPGRSSEWGIRTTWNPWHPLAQRTYRITNLPGQFAHDGVRVRGLVRRMDVIGTGTWDVVIEGVSLDSVDTH